jgi:uncharacterized protein
MATLRVTEHEIIVVLSIWEKLAALHGDVHVPRSALRGVEIVDDVVAAVQGSRAPGRGRPRSRAIGTWRHRHGRDFVVARSPRGVCLVLSGSPWSAVLVSHPDPEAVAAQLL